MIEKQTFSFSFQLFDLVKEVVEEMKSTTTYACCPKMLLHNTFTESGSFGWYF